MPSAKIAITVEEELLHTVDRWVAEGKFANRSQAIQVAIREKSDRWRRLRLAQETSKLRIREEQTLAGETFANEIWPES